jgi:hypothetical protein
MLEMRKEGSKLLTRTDLFARLLHHCAYILLMCDQGWSLSAAFYVASELERRKEGSDAE